MRAVVLFVVLSEADKTADCPALVTVQFDMFNLMLVTATRDILMRCYVIRHRHHLMFFSRRLTTMIPAGRNKF